MKNHNHREPDAYTDEMARRVIGASIEVHKTLGPGFLESVYESALCVELNKQDIPFQRQYELNIDYKGVSVGTGKVDILVDRCLIVELKTVEKFAEIHYAQVISYLKATDLQLGLLINFNVTLLKNGGIRRVIFS